MNAVDRAAAIIAARIVYTGTARQLAEALAADRLLVTDEMTNGLRLLDRMAEELARHGWGDMHYSNEMVQEPRVVALVDEYRAYLASRQS